MKDHASPTDAHERKSARASLEREEEVGPGEKDDPQHPDRGTGFDQSKTTHLAVRPSLCESAMAM
jgi:hypothetical protein